MKKLVLCISLSLLSGCASLSSFQEKQAALLKPRLINESTDSSSQAFRAQEAQENAYYAAMDAAMKPGAGQKDIQLWVDWGISRTIGECRSWFHRIDDTARQFNLGSKNVSVLENAGTAILGLASAAPGIVAGYGIATTTLSGLGDNFNAAFLSSPSQKNVENKIMEVMQGYAAQLKAESGTLTAPDVFTRLGTLADICNSPSIKGIVDGSLQQTTASITQAGTVTSIPGAANVASFLRDDSSERISEYWFPGAQTNRANLDKLTAWLEGHGINTSVTFFTSSNTYAPQRKQMVIDLAIPPVSPNGSNK